MFECLETQESWRVFVNGEINKKYKWESYFIKKGKGELVGECACACEETKKKVVKRKG